MLMLFSGKVEPGEVEELSEGAVFDEFGKWEKGMRGSGKGGFDGSEGTLNRDGTLGAAGTAWESR